MLKIIWSLFTSLSIRQTIVLFVLCCMPVIVAAQSVGNSSPTLVQIRVFPEGLLLDPNAVQFVEVCDRTRQVRDAITSLTGNSDCGEVSRADLESTTTTMDISEAGINSVSEGDFSGLSNLQDLDLGDNDLSTLPVGIFSGLSNLRFLRLYHSRISTLPSGIFGTG